MNTKLDDEQINQIIDAVQGALNSVLSVIELLDDDDKVKEKISYWAPKVNALIDDIQKDIVASL